MCNLQLIIIGTAMIPALTGKAGQICSANKKISRVYFMRSASPMNKE
jgi:hypothetical protein